MMSSLPRLRPLDLARGRRGAARRRADSRPASSCCGSASPRSSSARCRSSSRWGWQAQIIAFVVFSLAAVPLWRRISLAQKARRPTRRFSTAASRAFVGRVFTLEKPIVDGAGTVRIDDTIWRVTGPDTPAGNRVKVIRADGGLLTVESA